MNKAPSAKELPRLPLACDWFEEPTLQFGNGGRHEDPTVGIALYGPWSLNTARHKSEVHIGFIGTGEAINKATQFYSVCSDGVDGDTDQAPFPGCTKDAGFRLALRMAESFNEKITQSELADV